MLQTFPSLASELRQKQAKIGMVLGSGLGILADIITNKSVFAYQDIPELDFQCSVQGHSGKLVVGEIGNNTVACMQGRPHWYEGAKPEAFIQSMRLFKALGCETVILTNASGAIDRSMQVGELVLIKDHINLQGKNPLVGLKPVSFVGMENTYDLDLRHQLLAIAKEYNITVKQGVYCGVLGPSFETPAEIQAFATMGADIIGMSTVPEAIAARHLGLKVIALSVVSNHAAGISEIPLSHSLTLAGAAEGQQKAITLIKKFIDSSG